MPSFARLSNGTLLCGCHQPCARLLWNPLSGPALKSRDECFLRKILGKTDVPDKPRKTTNEPG